MRRTYCQIFPLAKEQPELLPSKPESNMFDETVLFNVGKMACDLLFIVPGIWFAIAPAPNIFHLCRPLHLPQLRNPSDESLRTIYA
jgi:hypothetical protein